MHGLTVELVGEFAGSAGPLGRTLTTKAGEFSFEYRRGASVEPSAANLDVGLRLLDRWGEPVHTIPEPIPWTPGHETLEVTLSAAALSRHLSVPTSWEPIEGPLVPADRLAEIDAAIDLLAERATAAHARYADTAAALRPSLLRFDGLLADALDAIGGDPAALRRFSSAVTMLGVDAQPATVEVELALLERWDETVGAAVAELPEDALEGLIPHDRLAPLILAAAYVGLAQGEPDRYLSSLNGQLCAMGPLESVAGAARRALGGDPRELEFFRSVLGELGAKASPPGGPDVSSGREPEPRLGPGPEPGPGPGGCPIPWPPRTDIDLREIVLKADPRDLRRLACMLQARLQIHHLGTIVVPYEIHGISPLTACPAQPIVISGSGFGSAAGQVSFPERAGTRAAVSVPQADWTDTQVTVTVPQEATCGALTLVKTAVATVEACGRFIDTAWPGISTATFGGALPHIKSFTANGKTGRLRVDPGASITFAWSACPTTNTSVALQIKERTPVATTTQTVPLTAGTGAYVLQAPATSQTTYLECTLTASNACTPTTQTSMILVKVAKLPDLTIQGIEVTQAIQYWRAAQHLTDANDRGNDNSLVLVADKETWVRTYVRSGQDPLFDVGLVPRVRAMLRVSRISGGTATLLDTLFPENFDVTAQANPAYPGERANPQQTLNFRVPGGLCKDLIRFDVELRTDYIESGVGPTKIEERDYTNNTWSESVDFSQRRVLRLRGVYIAYDVTDAKGNRTQLPAPTRTDLAITADWLERAYPVSEVTFADAGSTTLTVPLNDPPSCAGCCSPNWGTLLGLVAQVASADCNRPDSVYYGIFPSGVPRGPVIGCAGTAASGAVNDQVTMAHEVGHACGLVHAPCGSVGTAEPAYPAYEPYDAGGIPNASIGEFGLDIDNGTVLNPQTTRDFMSYCGPKWISIFTYNKLLAAAKLSPTIILCKAGGVLGPAGIGGQGSPEGNAVVDQDPVFGDYLHLTGMLGPDGVTLDPIHRVEGYPAAGGASVTAYRVSLLDDDGNELAADDVTVTHHHGPHGGCDHEDEPHAEPFYLSLPYRQGIRRVTVRRHGEEVLSRNVPQAEPTLEITQQPAGGHAGELVRLAWRAGHPEGRPLSYWVRYSIDDGETWQPLAIDLTEPAFEVALAPLGGGERCRLQIAAHDGFNSVYRQTDAFAVPLRAPEATILAPSDGTIVEAGRRVLLRGEGHSPQEGSLPHESVRWSSDRDGELGTGKRFYAKLSPGRHLVTLTVTDARGVPASAGVTVIIPTSERTD